jgi:hypothetical protein
MKERILSEIKRLAEENGGKPPGQRVFEIETGITRGQWRGKLWIGWRDALAEAGFSPNSVSERLDPEQVLDCYAEVCRHYQRPPTWAEWQFYARSKPDFVGVGSLHRTFGDTRGAIAALRNRAVEAQDAELLSLLPELKDEKTENKEEVAPKQSEGWVYLLQSGDHFKIGRSDELEKRVKQITIALPDKVELVHAIRSDDPPGIEAYWHRRFADQRANGEWFKLSSVDVKAFKRRKFQ